MKQLQECHLYRMPCRLLSHTREARRPPERLARRTQAQEKEIGESEREQESTGADTDKGGDDGETPGQESGSDDHQHREMEQIERERGDAAIAEQRVLGREGGE